MKKAAVLMAGLALALPALAADKWKEEFTKHWKVTKDFTLAVADGMPAEHYNFAPNAEEMVFGKLMAHIALANNNNFALVSGQKAPPPPQNIATAYKDPKGTFDKETVRKFLADSFDFCTRALEQINEDKLDTLTGPAGRQLTGRERLWSYFTHTAHHRGQAEVYMRVKDIKPPAYRF
jgi:uncharacterized damage-inducible protein DinB